MANTLEYLEQYGDQIQREKMGSRRTASLCGISRRQAEKVLKAIAADRSSKQTGIQLSGESCIYDAGSDIYLTAIQNRIVRMSGHQHRTMRAAFSGWNGQRSTIPQMALRMGMSASEVEAYYRSHRWHAKMDPLTPEAHEDLLTITEKVSEAIVHRTEQYERAFQRERQRRTERDASRWNRLEVEVKLLNKAILTPVPSHMRKPVPTLQLPQAPPFAMVMAPQDFHWGGHAWYDEAGNTYNRQEARNRLLSYTQEIARRLPGRPERIYLSVGGDWFHVDGDHSATTRGTPLTTDGTPSEVFLTGCLMACEHIDLLRQIAPVELVFMGGNHDRANSLALLMYLSGVYKNVPDVSVEVTCQLRSYRTYGNTLLGFTHGDKIKPNRLSSVMAIEAAKAWGDAKQRIWFTGHLHHEITREIDGIIHCQLPSLAGSDQWHKREGFVGARAGLAAHLIGEHGLFQSLFVSHSG